MIVNMMVALMAGPGEEDVEAGAEQRGGLATKVRMIVGDGIEIEEVGVEGRELHKPTRFLHPLPYPPRPRLLKQEVTFARFTFRPCRFPISIVCDGV